MPEGSPLNDIMQMRQQGLSNNQVIQNLQRQGYNNTQIFDAMNQADTKTAVEGSQPMQQLFTQPPEQVMASPAATVEQPTLQEAPPTESQQTQEPFSDMTPTQSYTSPNEQVQVEELVEAIIEEKWNDLIREVNKVVDWKNKIESRITDIEMKLNSLKDNYSNLNKAVLGKINDYDKNILEVGADVKAMEKVFSKVLPTFTENVNELTKIADKLKGDKK